MSDGYRNFPPECSVKKTWFITGASRGFGTEIAKAALAAGDNVVAAARNTDAVHENLGPDGAQLLTVKLDVTQADQARAAVKPPSRNSAASMYW